MNKLILNSLLLLISFVAMGQDQIKMNWKIKPNDTLIYTTVMEQLDSSYFEMSLGGIFDSIVDSSSAKQTDRTKEFFKQINQAIGKTQYAVRMYKSDQGHIEIEMFTVEEAQPLNLTDTLNDDTKKMLEIFQKMSTGIVLRGAINEDGTIHSFWIKRAQKNLVAMLFELPGRIVGIGDSWSLSTNLIGNDHNFVCDSSYRKNEVRLIDIKEVDGDDIAVLKYDLQEYVSGAFNVSIFGEGSKQTTMNFGFQGIAEFSVKRGRWISYDGVMFGDATGVMTSRQRVKYALIEQ